MKTSKSIFITVTTLLIFISGCAVISYHPLYTEDVLVRDDNIIGHWETIENNKKDTLVWEISFDKKKSVKSYDAKSGDTKTTPNKYAYSLILYPANAPESKSEFLLHIVKLGSNTYLDFYPEYWDSDETILDLHLMPVHTFAQVDIKTDQIAINWLDSEWFKKKIEANKIRIKHENNSEYILLTAQPKEIQKFVSKYAGDPKAFGEGVQFVLNTRK